MDRIKNDKSKHLGLRIDSELHYKLHYISQYDGRSANGEVIYLIRKYIEEFEKKYPVSYSIVVPGIPEGHVAKVVSVRPC